MWTLLLLWFATDLAHSGLASNAVANEYSYSYLTLPDALKDSPAKVAEQEQVVNDIISRKPSSAINYNDMLVRYELNLRSICREEDGPDAEGRYWEHYFIDAECDLKSRNPRRIKLTCGSQVRNGAGTGTIRSGPNVEVYPECPIPTVCHAVYLMTPPVLGRGPKENIGCIAEKDLVKQTVTSKASKSGDQKVHCGLSLSLPGPHYRARPGQMAIDLVLTEQVTYPDGTPYPAPLLFIRDKSDPYHMDRAVRKGGDVTSLIVELGTYRGNFISKQYEFCMQMLPGHFTSSVIFSYAFFQVVLRHGNIPGEPWQLEGSTESVDEAAP